MLKTGILFFLLAVSLLAAEGKKHFIIGVENINYYPYCDFSEKEGKKAFFTELIDAFSKASGYTFSYKPLPVKRLYAELLESEQIDFKFPDNRLWGEELKKGHEVYYSAPIAEYTDGVMVLPERLSEGMESFKILGTIAGFSPWPFMDRINQKEIKESQNRTLAALIKTTLGGRNDGAYVNVAVAKNILKLMGREGALQFNRHLPYDHNAYALSTTRYPEVLEAMNHFIRQNGVWIKALKARYRIIGTEQP